MSDKLLDSIVDKYYDKIYNYCFAQLNYSHHDATDCTQEVFFTLLKKKKILVFSPNIKLWLYRTADNVIRNYIRKNLQKNPLDIDNIDIPVDNNFEIRCSGNALDVLSDEEIALLEDYYGEFSADREALAQKYGISTGNLYKKIHDIKLKLR